MINNIFMLVICHAIGDYVLQNDFIAKTKGENLYHLFIHSILYCSPFYILLGIDLRLLIIFISHFLIDILKVRYNKLNYIQDQFLHYLVMFIYLL